jgi:hypothetical protein
MMKRSLNVVGESLNLTETIEPKSLTVEDLTEATREAMQNDDWDCVGMLRMGESGAICLKLENGHGGELLAFIS